MYTEQSQSNQIIGSLQLQCGNFPIISIASQFHSQTSGVIILFTEIMLLAASLEWKCAGHRPTQAYPDDEMVLPIWLVSAALKLDCGNPEQIVVSTTDLHTCFNQSDNGTSLG